LINSSSPANISAQTLSAYLLLRYALSQVADRIERSDPDHAKNEAARVKSAAILRRLDSPESEDESPERDGTPRRTRKEDLQLSQYEHIIANDVVAPEDIPVTFEDIGGLSDIIEELKESVIYPLTMPHLYSRSSSLLSAPSGVLLYGPPGCGKTMLAKALAHESGACFINLHISTVTEKWYGDSNKLVNAVFSLARKLQPSIVFIDEIDAVLGTRRSGEHEASNMVKAEFMTHWDGLTSSNTSGRPERILILGATNRIQDIDEAILRRMPKKFPVSLPGSGQRLKILGLVLKDTKVDQQNFDVHYLVRVMAGMSGSDIKEACRDAAMVPVREFIKRKRDLGARMDAVDPTEVRGVRTEDFFIRAGGIQLMHSNVSKERKDVGQRDSKPLTDSEASETSSSDTEEMEDAIEAPD
jgi:ATPase family AAA domain-containing protein 1